MRARDVCHGDLYAHNILVNEAGDILLGDFGAASHYPALDPAQAKALEAIEVRAFGCFLEDILGVIKSENRAVDFISVLEKMSQECVEANITQRPSLAQIQKRVCAL